MQTVYLADGTKANLITKTDKGFVVDPINVYQDYESEEEYEESTGNVKMVDKVYEKPPTEVIEEEYKLIKQKVKDQCVLLSEKMAELNRAKYELSQVQQQKTDAAKMIINRSELVNAKRLIVWIKGWIAPRIMDVKSSLKLTISYTISRYEGEEKCWAYGTWSDYDGDKAWSKYSEYFDPAYGIKADLTDEEILQITHERQNKNEFGEWEISRTDEKWLTSRNIEKRNAHIEQANKNELKNAENDLKIAQEKYNLLLSKRVVVNA